jgi:hypothetical protein
MHESRLDRATLSTGCRLKREPRNLGREPRNKSAGCAPRRNLPELEEGPEGQTGSPTAAKTEDFTLHFDVLDLIFYMYSC